MSLLMTRFSSFSTINLDRLEVLRSSVPFRQLILGNDAQQLRNILGWVRPVDLDLFQYTSINRLQNIRQSFRNKVIWKKCHKIRKFCPLLTIAFSSRTVTKYFLLLRTKPTWMWDPISSVYLRAWDAMKVTAVNWIIEKLINKHFM